MSEGPFGQVSGSRKDTEAAEAGRSSGQRKRRATEDTGSNSTAAIKTEGEHQKLGEAQAAIRTMQGMKTEADPNANLN